jgi:hypothetical protein
VTLLLSGLLLLKLVHGRHQVVNSVLEYFRWQLPDDAFRVLSTFSRTLTGCTLKGNSTSYGDGGAIYNNAYATATLTGCSLNSNWAEGYGGCIFNQKHGKLTIQSSNITGNADARGVTTKRPWTPSAHPSRNSAFANRLR